MIIVDLLLFGVVASMFTLKVALLALATVLFVRSVNRRLNDRKIGLAPVPVSIARKDTYADF